MPTTRPTPEPLTISSSTLDRIREAIRKAENEAAMHHDIERARYCEGTAHGLRAALRMLGVEA